jgi:hypothetical protein
MEKQTKVVRTIKAVGTRGSGLNLGIKKNDECYTSMNDIMTELSQWATLDKFRGKNIICPCDWDIVGNENIYSITITYKAEGIEVIGNGAYKTVESVQYDLWSNDDTPVITHITLEEDEIEDFLRNKLTCNFVRTLTQNARRWGIKSITASGYNPATDKGIKFQEVDYSKYDVCVTNPPFSLYDEFMKAIISKIDFIVLAPFLDRKSTFIGIPLMEQRAFLGFSGDTAAGYIPMSFRNPTQENQYNTKKVACEWVTSFKEAQVSRNQRLAGKVSGIAFAVYQNEYDTLPGMVMKDGTTPIKVPCHAIPDDYEGWMFSAINVLTKINLTEYEWYITNFTSYYNYEKPELSPFLGKIASKTIHKLSTGKDGFCGIVFRKKPVGGLTND